MALKTYKDLEVWKKSVDLVTTIYQITKDFPKDEIYSLTNQMRRAAVSIPSNIAEGRAKGTTREFIHFINVSSGSLAELETQLVISEKLGYLSLTKLNSLLELTNYIERMLNKLNSGLKARLAAAT